MKSHLHTHRLARIAATALAIATFAAPAALARPIDSIEPNTAPTSAPPASVKPVDATDQGFDWGAAGIGAGVAVGIVVLTAAGVFVRPRASVGRAG